MARISICKAIIIVILFSVFITTQANEADTTLQDSRLNFGLNFYSLVHIPLISVEYQISNKYILSLEAKPRLNFLNSDSTVLAYDNYIEKIYLENTFFQGFSSFISLKKKIDSKKKWFFSYSAEIGFIYKYGKDFIKINGPEWEYSKIINHNYYYTYSKSQFILNSQFSYERSKIRFYTSFGISYNLENNFGYSYKSIPNNKKSIEPMMGLKGSISPYIRVGARIKLFQIKKQS